MGSIFNQASRVIVWFGAADDNNVLDFRVLSHPNHGRKFILASKEPVTQLGGKKKLKALFSILTREYWARLWIIQEFLMARDFVIQCGQDACSRSLFCHYLDAIECNLGVEQSVPESTISRSRGPGSIGWSNLPIYLARLVRRWARPDCPGRMLKNNESELLSWLWFKLFLHWKVCSSQSYISRERRPAAQARLRSAHPYYATRRCQHQLHLKPLTLNEGSEKAFPSVYQNVFDYTAHNSWLFLARSSPFLIHLLGRALLFPKMEKKCRRFEKN